MRATRSACPTRLFILWGCLLLGIVFLVGMESSIFRGGGKVQKNARQREREDEENFYYAVRVSILFLRAMFQLSRVTVLV